MSVPRLELETNEPTRQQRQQRRAAERRAGFAPRYHGAKTPPQIAGTRRERREASRPNAWRALRDARRDARRDALRNQGGAS
jgi:hypothetical protein